MKFRTKYGCLKTLWPIAGAYIRKPMSNRFWLSNSGCLIRKPFLFDHRGVPRKRRVEYHEHARLGERNINQSEMRCSVCCFLSNWFLTVIVAIRAIMHLCIYQLYQRNANQLLDTLIPSGYCGFGDFCNARDVRLLEIQLQQVNQNQIVGLKSII